MLPNIICVLLFVFGCSGTLDSKANSTSSRWRLISLYTSPAVGSPQLEEGGQSFPVRLVPLTISLFLPARSSYSQMNLLKLSPIISQNHIAIANKAVGNAIIFKLRFNPVFFENMGNKDVLNAMFCSKTAENVNSIFIITDKTVQGHQGNMMEKFVQLIASKAGIPTLAWSSSTSELADDTKPFAPLFVSSPSIKSYVQAVGSYLLLHPRYRFSVLAGKAQPGHDHFIRLIVAHHLKIRDLKSHNSHFERKHHRLQTLVIDHNWKSLRSDLLLIRGSVITTRHVIIIFADEKLSNEALRFGEQLGMVSNKFIWFFMRPSLGDDNKGSGLKMIPTGSLALTYDTSKDAQVDAVDFTVKVWTEAIHRLVRSHNLTVENAAARNVCTNGELWTNGHYLNNICKEIIEQDRSKGNLNEKIMVFESSKNGQWVEVGQWNASKGLVMNTLQDQVESDHMRKTFRVVTLSEPPFIIYKDPEIVFNRTHFKCKFGLPITLATSDGKPDPSHKCASGLFIDILMRLSIDLHFKVQLYEVLDRKWGAIDENGQWNGLVKDLIADEADFAMTSLKINRQRSEVIQFTTPILETGITMMVSVKDASSSATAFLEPYSLDAWIGILAISILVSIVVFIFEYIICRFENNWSVPYTHLHLIPSFWLTFSMLTKSILPVELPRRSFAARLLIAIWGVFSVVFASFYTANLAVFMISKDEFYEFQGLDDGRLLNPDSKDPPWTFSTVKYGATETYLRSNYPLVFETNSMNNRNSKAKILEELKQGEIDAFIYDAAALDYIAKQDKDCAFRLTGKVHAHTGYGIGFPYGSQWMKSIDKQLIEYRNTGVIDGLRRFWITGQCDSKSEDSKSRSLGLNNMQSVFYFLAIGFLFAILSLFCHKTFPTEDMVRHHKINIIFIFPFNCYRKRHGK